MATRVVRRFAQILIACACIVAGPAAARDLPQHIAPAAPFSRILTQATTFWFVAPGVQYGDYELLTVDGPMAVHVVSVNARRHDVRVGAVSASDRLASNGETTSAMARRTAAVAGINGDYFDIGNTNAPLNVLVRNGQLLRTPRKRYALAITREGRALFAEFTFSGTVIASERTNELNAVNELRPPGDGASLLTPEFGSVPASENLTLAQLQPDSGSPPFAHYHVTGIADNTVRQPPGYYLAIGLNAYGSIGVPDQLSAVEASGDLDPIGLAGLTAVVGGGPLILHNGTWFEDPDGPSGGEFSSRIPASGAAIEPDGTLLLIEVDGRQPLTSIGITRGEFAALMHALGAVDGMAFDGGGSSTLVVRRPGDADATLQTSPSDGRERVVADGVFVYSTAPIGPVARVAVIPETIRALPGARIPLHVAVTDAAGHPIASSTPLRMRVDPAAVGSLQQNTFVAVRAGRAFLHVRRGGVTGDIAIEVVARPARLEIVPKAPNLQAGERVQFVARAYDADGYGIALPERAAWSATSGSIDADGTYIAGGHDATITLRAGEAIAYEHVTVGQHDASLSIGRRLRFSTAPQGGPGSAEAGVPCATCVQLHYDFTGEERAAYANVDVALPPGTTGLTFDVLGDGRGAVLRVAVRNAINERILLTATRLDFTVWRHIRVLLPNGMAQPATLASIYAINAVGGQPVHTAGTVAIRDVRAILPGRLP